MAKDDTQKILQAIEDLARGQKELTKGQEEFTKGQSSLMERVGKNESMIRAVINGQSAMKAELLGEIKKVREDLGGRIDGVEIELKKTNKRLDKIGYGVAELSDDAPTREEFDKLETRVTTLESASV